MSRHLKKILYIGLATLMIASTGATLSTGYYANASRKTRTEKVYHHKIHRRNGKKRTVKRHGKTTHRSHRSKRSQSTKARKQNVKRYNCKAKRMNKMNKKRRTKKHSRKNRSKALKSRFKRSNSKRALKRSGFFNAHAIGGNFIFDKYAPNDKRAVVPKRVDVSNWYKGRFGQKNPTGYVYIPELKGWIVLK